MGPSRASPGLPGRVGAVSWGCQHLCHLLGSAPGHSTAWGCRAPSLARRALTQLWAGTGAGSHPSLTEFGFQGKALILLCLVLWDVGAALSLWRGVLWPFLPQGDLPEPEGSSRGWHSPRVSRGIFWALCAGGFGGVLFSFFLSLLQL